MTREELEHIIRASGDITDQYEFVIVGSQSMLGPVPNPEAEFTMSMEADIYPLMAPELADRIDGAIGERGGSANPDIELSEISASMGDGNRLPRSRSNEKTPP